MEEDDDSVRVRMMIEASNHSMRNVNNMDASTASVFRSADFSEHSGASGGVYDSVRASNNEPESHRQQKEFVKQLAERETRKVNLWRRNVFLVVAATAVFVTSMTFFFLEREDEETFKQSVSEAVVAVK